MIAHVLTTDEIRSCEGREYNPQSWETAIDRMVNNYKDVIFYHVPKGDGYDYDRYFVEYTLPEGLRLFGDFGYGGGITSGGFYRLDKSQRTADGRNYKDLHQLLLDENLEGAKALMDEIDNSKIFKISYGKFHNPTTGEMVMVGTSKEARAWMTQRSIKYEMTFTKG
jgi:hypothetical protein